MALIANKCIIYVPKEAVFWINTSMKVHIKVLMEKNGSKRREEEDEDKIFEKK